MSLCVQCNSLSNMARTWEPYCIQPAHVNTGLISHEHLLCQTLENINHNLFQNYG
jgi:hypothetical protein